MLSRCQDMAVRFFDGWVMVGTLLVQVNDHRPNEEKQRAWVELSLSVLPNAPRGGFFSLPVHKKGPERFAKQLGSAMFSIEHQSAVQKLTTSKSRGGPLSLSLRGFFFLGRQKSSDLSSRNSNTSMSCCMPAGVSILTS